ncbi:MAG: T9SS type A sorting domain-containing protein [Candidatus Hatepunaea meridiana]|nr:T9SS type A sorting domain-containing protein [Candidatus Hatepunaea meridiana]
MYRDSVLVFSIDDGEHIYAEFDEDELTITSEEDWIGIDSLRFIVLEEDDEDNGDTTYLRITVHLQNAVEFPSYELPQEYNLAHIYPNPFNSLTTIRYELPEKSLVSIKILDVSGRKIETIIENQHEAGYHHTIWNGSKYPSGVYFCWMEVAGFERTIKLSLIR